MESMNLTKMQLGILCSKIGHENAMRILSGDSIVVKVPDVKWYENENLIYFTLISKGVKGKGWIEIFEKRGYFLHEQIKSILTSRYFSESTDRVYKIVVIKGESYNDVNRKLFEIEKNARSRSFKKLPAEVSCLIREKFTNDDILKMGLTSIGPLHEPIWGKLLRCDTKRNFSFAFFNKDTIWCPGAGFAFLR